MYFIKILLLISIFLPQKALSNKAEENYNFNSIRDVLKSDMLDSHAEKKEKKRKEKLVRIKRSQVKKYSIPAANDIWSFISEYWLVKNAPLLKWDFHKPDYGLEVSFKDFLERMGIYGVKFKVLLVNTPNITHFSLPSSEGEVIFLLSVPFIRTLDLSKLEISLLLYEDYIRLKKGYFKKFVETKKLLKLFNSNFHNKKKIDFKIFTEVYKKYDEIVYDKGFTFQQQFEVTKDYGRLLKSDLKLWNSYLKMIMKIDNLVKTNILYDKYNKIYPSPEWQINWLNPKNKVL